MAANLLKIIVSYDFRNTLLNQALKVLCGPLILIIIPLFLTSEEQGFWFTFTSLAALVVFADMGFSNILLQFSAHEFANLEFDKNREIRGEKHRTAKLASLWRFSRRWAAIMGTLAFPLFFLIGLLLFKTRSSEVDWLIPWTIYGLASLVAFTNSISLSFFEGCDNVGEVQGIRLKILLVNFGSLILALLLNGGLYALALSLSASSLFGFFFIRTKFANAINQFSQINNIAEYKWGREILPLLSRYSISWVSGYFIFQAFTPIAFYHYGPEVSGKIGLSTAVIMAIFGLANVWMVVITPKINILVAKRKYKDLNHIFFRNMHAAAATYALGITVLWVCAKIVEDYFPITERLTSPILMAMLATGWLGQIYINGMAIYIRAHKQEPLMFFSLAMSAYVASGTFFSAKFLSIDFYFVGFLTSYVWAIPFVIIVFRKFYYKK